MSQQKWEHESESESRETETKDKTETETKTEPKTEKPQPKSNQTVFAVQPSAVANEVNLMLCILNAGEEQDSYTELDWVSASERERESSGPKVVLVDFIWVDIYKLLSLASPFQLQLCQLLFINFNILVVASCYPISNATGHRPQDTRTGNRTHLHLRCQQLEAAGSSPLYISKAHPQPPLHTPSTLDSRQIEMCAKSRLSKGIIALVTAERSEGMKAQLRRLLKGI